LVYWRAPFFSPSRKFPLILCLKMKRKIVNFFIAIVITVPDYNKKMITLTKC
jgi:hypothetical protein